MGLFLSASSVLLLVFLFLTVVHADLLVSNPPYVPQTALRTLAPEIVRYEDHRALFSGPDGLRTVRYIIRIFLHHDILYFFLSNSLSNFCVTMLL